MIKVVDDLLTDAAFVGYEVLEFELDEAEELKKLVVRQETVRLELIFPKTKTVEYFDKETNEISRVPIIDTDRVSQAKAYLENKSLVLSRDAVLHDSVGEALAAQGGEDADLPHSRDPGALQGTHRFRLQPHLPRGHQTGLWVQPTKR